PQDHGAPADRAAAPTSAGVRCVNGVSIGCRAVQPGTSIDRKPNATIGPQENSQARGLNDFFDSIGQARKWLTAKTWSASPLVTNVPEALQLDCFGPIAALASKRKTIFQPGAKLPSPSFP